MTNTTMMPVSDAETGLLVLLRGAALRRFSLTVTALDGAWTVKITDIAASNIRETMGRSFDEAWTGTPAERRGPLTIIEGGKE